MVSWNELSDNSAICEGLLNSTWPCHIGKKQTSWSLCVFILIYCPNKLNAIFSDFESGKAVQRCSYMFLYLFIETILIWLEILLPDSVSVVHRDILSRDSGNLPTSWFVTVNSAQLKLYSCFCNLFWGIIFLDWTVFRYSVAVRVPWRLSSWNQVVKLTAISLRPFTRISWSTNLWFCHYVFSPTLCSPVFPHCPVVPRPQSGLFLIPQLFPSWYGLLPHASGESGYF